MNQRQMDEILEEIQKLRSKVNSLEQANGHLERTLGNVINELKAMGEIIGTQKNKIEELEGEQVKSKLRITIIDPSLDPATRQNAHDELGKILEKEARLAELDRPAVRPQENNEEPELSTFIK